MKSRIADLRCKEIINVTDGSRFGYVGDVEVDLDTGQICALVVPGRLRLFGLLGREEDRIFPWESVRRFGEDIILVESGALRAGREERRRSRREG
ncbi:YlmC/YmxH family sporulation protein [Pseudoflavonifractor capillosus]|uniref:YlmC/YmxH family sporulation protein n=1 Tax=Pseudoflavonifractor capillosus TaxID=106588 RepID=A0A921MLK3_9FIRM|nr:YlmC/YmxH family sporulation protein [Pseudoflavonifractor capillosus]HJG86442.1 YlmC/YmxH family sporulation protein [Pseudoflavonifractor capillosus]